MTELKAEFPNLNRAWIALLVDNVPAQIRNEDSFDRIASPLDIKFGPESMLKAEQALAVLSPDEIDDLCWGGEDEQDETREKIRDAGHNVALVDSILDYMWTHDSLGIDPRDR